MKTKTLKRYESLYLYSSPSDIASRAGLIGYLRADMGEDGTGFYSSWTDYDKNKNTKEFKDGFDAVINGLRRKNEFLNSRDALRKFCSHYCEMRLKDGQDDYGVRIDDGTYTYLMRLNPNKGEYNLYCYCYLTSLFEQRLKDAAKGIRFITPEYGKLFRVADGDRIKIINKSTFKAETRVCRYIDEYHAVIGSSIYHTCEFAEAMQNRNTVALPERLYVTDIDWDIDPDEEGYTPTADELDLPSAVTMELNSDYILCGSFDELLDQVTDDLSDMHGFCIRGFKADGMEA